MGLLCQGGSLGSLWENKSSSPCPPVAVVISRHSSAARRENSRPRIQPRLYLMFLPRGQCGSLRWEPSLTLRASPKQPLAKSKVPKRAGSCLGSSCNCRRWWAVGCVGSCDHPGSTEALAWGEGWFQSFKSTWTSPASSIKVIKGTQPSGHGQWVTPFAVTCKQKRSTWVVPGLSLSPVSSRGLFHSSSDAC